MRRSTLLILSVAALLVALAGPVMAQDFDFDDLDDGFFFIGDDRFDFDDDDDDFDFFGGGGEFGQAIGQESESGDVAIESSVSSEGDYSMQCVAPLQFGNSGNLQSAQGFSQFGSDADDLDAEGSSFEFAPAIETTCDQAVQQSSAASSK